MVYFRASFAAQRRTVFIVRLHVIQQSLYTPNGKGGGPASSPHIERTRKSFRDGHGKVLDCAGSKGPGLIKLVRSQDLSDI